MKKAFLHLASVLLCLLCATACSDDEKETTPAPEPPGQPEQPVPFAPLPANTVAGNQLVFSGQSTTVSRMGKLYLTDFAGTNITELK